MALLRDEEEAGYFYSDLAQLLGEDGVLFFPSAYRRAIRYGHRDESSALLRSMVLSALISAAAPGGTPLPILVTYPEALMEGIPQESSTKEEPLIIHRGDVIERDHLRDQLLAWGFERVDYVYEPGSSPCVGASSTSIPLPPSSPTVWTSSMTKSRACAASRSTASSPYVSSQRSR